MENVNLTNPTAGRGTPVWAPLYHTGEGKRLMSAGWLLSYCDRSKVAKVWVGPRLLSFPIGSLHSRNLSR